MSTKKTALEYLEKQYGPLTFAKVLKAWREADEVSQTALAKKLGLTVQSLCDLEKGRRIPSPARAAKIAKKLGAHELVWIQLAIQDSLHSEGFHYEVKLTS